MSLAAWRALAGAGFTPDDNVCNACHHHGSRHDLNNRCLDCGDYFASMTDDEKWQNGLAALNAAGYDVTRIEEGERLRGLSDAASPGPWVAEPWGMDAAVRRADGSRMNIGDALYHPRYAADAEFIVAAVAYVRAALAASDEAVGS